MAPGLEALRNGATSKCVLLRRPVQSVESRGFKMDSEFFPGVVPLSLILFMHFRSLLLGSEILRLGRGGAGRSWALGRAAGAGGARLRERAPGWYLFPVYWFPGGEQALLPELEGGRPGVLAASQPHSLASWDC